MPKVTIVLDPAKTKPHSPGDPCLIEQTLKTQLNIDYVNWGYTTGVICNGKNREDLQCEELDKDRIANTVRAWIFDKFCELTEFELEVPEWAIHNYKPAEEVKFAIHSHRTIEVSAGTVCDVNGHITFLDSDGAKFTVEHILEVAEAIKALQHGT